MSGGNILQSSITWWSNYADWYLLKLSSRLQLSDNRMFNEWWCDSWNVTKCNHVAHIDNSMLTLLKGAVTCHISIVYLVSVRYQKIPFSCEYGMISITWLQNYPSTIKWPIHVFYISRYSWSLCMAIKVLIKISQYIAYLKWENSSMIVIWSSLVTSKPGAIFPRSEKLNRLVIGLTAAALIKEVAGSPGLSLVDHWSCVSKTGFLLVEAPGKDQRLLTSAHKNYDN